ncbi:unnamed protein product, partial [Symbiodinium necroappetens]
GAPDCKGTRMSEEEDHWDLSLQIEADPPSPSDSLASFTLVGAPLEQPAPATGEVRQVHLGARSPPSAFAARQAPSFQVWNEPPGLGLLAPGWPQPSGFCDPRLPFSEMDFDSLVAAESGSVEIVEFSWPVLSPDQASYQCLAYCIMKRPSGFLLCVPEGFLPQEELDRGQAATEVDGIGPSFVASAPAVVVSPTGEWSTPAEAELVPAIVVDLSAQVASQLAPADFAAPSLYTFKDDNPAVFPRATDIIRQARDWIATVDADLEEEAQRCIGIGEAVVALVSQLSGSSAELSQRTGSFALKVRQNLERKMDPTGMLPADQDGARDVLSLMLVMLDQVAQDSGDYSRTKTSGPNRRVRELPVAISEYAFFVKSRWRAGAGYADAMVATAGLLATLLGLPLEVQGYWTEHSERSVLPTALSLQDIPPHDKDLLGRWKPEGSDIYARFWGRVARLQALFAETARGADRYQKLDEREIAADLVPWLMERPGLSREQAELTAEGLRRSWREGGLGAPDPIPATLASEEPPLGGARYESGPSARFVCSARARMPDMYNNATMGLGLPSGRGAGGGGSASGPSDDADGPAKAVQILETLRAMRQLVTFCPDELPEAFANHFSRGQILEMEARLEDAKLAMDADQPPAKPARDAGAQRFWLAGGRAASPQRDMEYRALRATAWSDFTQEEVDAMSSVTKQSLTRRLARQEQDAAKAKARAEAEAIAKEQARKKKTEHDAKVAQAAMDSVKKEAARKREEALRAILEQEKLELEKYEQDLEAARRASLGEEVDASDPAAASSSATPPASTATGTSRSTFPPLRPEAKSQVRGRTSDATDTAGGRRRSKSAANKSGVGPEPSLSWGDIFGNNTYLRPLRAACQDDAMGPAKTASDCKGTTLTVELFGGARPPLQSRCNAFPQGKGSYKLDLSWHAIDRDLWTLGSWNKSLGQGPRDRPPRYLDDLQVRRDRTAN